ncbi:DNA cytosine methyltransferase [Methylocaldum sp. 14B]|uniref:DNA cytosine methyltransferase n=1 Tax=Methylocaldum sp. 14B TaxID=1912213 RepID=UPI00197B72D4|nr:DNA cytosine methyltransferase [Methylocaldum sp. 14B]
MQQKRNKKNLTMPVNRIPVVDLFAGPGGLSEGFSSLTDAGGEPLFDVRVSIEKDPHAFETLKLRSFFRAFPSGSVPDCYYDYIRGSIGKEDLTTNKLVKEEWLRSGYEARCATLGEISPKIVNDWIREAIGNQDPWVLIGGPPCQAYSVVGRARMRRGDPHAFENDKRHFLYQEYLRIIKEFKPAVFVMENVKGILSSKHGGSPIFDRILDDLSHPEKDLEYEIRSFVRENGNSKPSDFVIEAEWYGIPQRRHRVVLFGVRQDYAARQHHPLVRRTAVVPIEAALSGMPEIRSRLSIRSRKTDSFENWLQTLKDAPSTLERWQDPRRSEIEELMVEAIQQAQFIESSGAGFIENSAWSDRHMPAELSHLIRDSRLGGVCQHEARSHMPSDLHRYLFAACYAEIHKKSPTLAQFPLDLWPEHKNVNAEEVPFDDRFRVQCRGIPATTVVSHIAKDGHYYIHPDPCQCRSLTIREAARLQTFPDNYFFEGPKKHQYTQVGNAVPPYLAKQIADVVAGFLAAPAKKDITAAPVLHRSRSIREECLAIP